MTRYRVVHNKNHGFDLILVPVDSSFGEKPKDAQQAWIEKMQAAATSAQMTGTVAVAWEADGHMKFFGGPPGWSPILDDYTNVVNITKDLGDDFLLID